MIHHIFQHQKKSRVEGNLFLGNYSDASNLKMNNGTLLAIASIIKHVVSSFVEAVMGALFINTKEAEVIRTRLEEMGWPQPKPTPISTDNSTAVGISNNKINQRRSKAMDMRFYWYQDRVSQ